MMRLKQRVELQEVTTAQDSSTGELTESWATYRRCWADVADVRGTESLRGGADTEAIVDSVVTIRYPREGRLPTSEDRVIYDENGTAVTRTLNVSAVKRMDDGRRWMELHCKEDVS